MNVSDILQWENTTLVCGETGLEKEITNGYVSDLLSDVMGNAEEGMAWITIQTHKNLVAVASLKELACIIITSGNKPTAELLAAAQEEEIPVITTPSSSFECTGMLYNALKG
ncbi:MAG: serine kinase [Bacteroidetes bacterium]|nr:MAG: serine kinase [Bacteroidota bacterium]